MEKAPAQRHPAKTDGQQKSSLNASHVIAKQTAVNDSPDRSSSRVHNGLSDHLLHLQRVLGNRAVGRLIQAKLSISHPDDPYEREADQVADTVMRMPEPEASEASDTPMQTKPSAPRITPLVQRETEIGDDEEDIEVEPTLQRELGDGSEDEEDDIVATKPLIQRMPESELEEGEEEEAVGANSSLQRMPEPEPEADAESVVATQPLIQRMTAVDSEENEEETVAAKRESGAGLQVRRQEEEEEELVQSKLDISYNPAIQRQDEEEDEDEEPVQAGPLVQRQVEEEEDELAQTKPIENRLVASRETPIQPKGVSAPAPQVSSATAANVQALKGGGSPLPQSTRAFFEPRFGVDFSQVRVHTDSRATETTKSIHARAFTVGRDIAFGTGRYAPHSHEGRQLLAHELTHVVQQNGSQLLPVQPQATDRVIRVATSLTPDAEIKKGSEIPDEGLNASRGNADRLARRGLMQREMISRRPAERGNSRKVISNFLSTPVQVSSVSRFLQRNTASGVGSSVLQGSGRQMVFRDPVAPTPVARRTAANLFGDGTPANPGLTLAEFEVYTRIQADWFVEPSLTSGDRNDLWNLLLRLNTGSHILAGVGDLKLSALRAVSASDWLALAAFGRCCHTGGNTIRIAAAAAYTLPQRIALGKTLLNLESLIPPELLKLTVSEVQLSDVQAGGLMLFAKLAMYWLTFQPHLQQTYAPVAGARGPEFQRVLDLINGPGIIPFLPLLGRIRNLHRFSVAMLTALVSNFADTSRSKPVHLVLHTGHDERAFQESAHLFEDLVVNSPNLVLMLEGQASLAAITARIPALAAAYGQPDATGNHRIAQAMIAGHGQARTVQIAGTGAPTVGAGRVDYPSESIDLDRNAAASTALIDTLLRHLDPATARLVYAGCLVGSNPVPLGTPAAAIPGHIAANPSLGTFTEQRGAVPGLSPGFVSAARASVGLSAATSLRDVGGNLVIEYPFDPTAFGSAAVYLVTGHEPEGLFRAAVEVAATASPVAAEMQLRLRRTLGHSSSDPWWDEAVLALVNVALDGVAFGSGVSVVRLNALAHLASIPFLARFGGSYGITPAHFISRVNSQAALAGSVYTHIMATPTMTTPPDVRARIGRFVFEQGWLAFGGARAAALITYLDATPQLTAELIGNHLDTGASASSSPTLFAAGAAATSGRVRLALAWLRKDPANADVRAFLNGQVLTPAGGSPVLSAAVRAEFSPPANPSAEREVLLALGRLTATTSVTPPGGPTVTLPNANVQVTSDPMNRVRVVSNPYVATVLPHALNVRRLPSMKGTVFAWLKRSETVRVMGFTHNWAAVDRNGRLGFVHRSQLTPP